MGPRLGIFTYENEQEAGGSSNLLASFHEWAFESAMNGVFEGRKAREVAFNPRHE